MEVSYQFLEDLFSGFWELPQIKVMSLGVKVILVGAVVMRLTYMLVVNYRSDTGDKFPLTTKGLIGIFATIISIAFYDNVLVFMDSILSLFFANFPVWENQSVVMFRPDLGSGEETQNLDTWGTMKMMGTRVVGFLANPLALVSEVLMFLFWLVEYVIVAIFIGERFFVLMLLKMIGPLVWALSMFPRFSPMLWNWVKLYITWYLLLLPYMIVNLLVNAINLEFGSSLKGLGINEGVADSMTIFLLPISLLLIVLKFKLYSAGKNLVREIVDVSTNDDWSTSD